MNDHTNEGSAREREQLKRAAEVAELSPAEVEAQLRRFRQAAPASPRVMRWKTVGIHTTAAAAVIAVSLVSMLPGPVYVLEKGRIQGSLATGSQIRAEEDAVITIRSRVRVALEGGSEFGIDDPARVRLTRGTAVFAVTPGTPFQVVTPCGAVDVKGTEFRIHIYGEESMSKVFVAVLSGMVALSGPQGNAIANAGEAIRTDARAIRAVSLPDEITRLEADLKALEQSIDRLRNENDAAVANAVQSRQDEAARTLAELEKRFDELAKDLDPDVQMAARMFLFNQKAAREFLRMQGRQDAANAIRIKVDGNEPPDSLKAGGGLKQLESLIVAGLAEAQALELGVMTFEWLKTCRDSTDEEVLKELRRLMADQQRARADKMYGDIESALGPAVREFAARQIQGAVGLQQTIRLNVFGARTPPTDWWSPIAPVLPNADLHPFGQASRVLLPSELEALERALKAAVEKSPEELRVQQVGNIGRVVGAMRVRSRISLQVVQVARKLVQ